MLGSLLPLPRLFYAMGSDGVIFLWCGLVNSFTKTPLLATIVAGFFTALMSVFFDIDHLIDMMSIGTLMAYTIVCNCILKIRYECREFPEPPPEYGCKDFMQQLINFQRIKEPSLLSSRICSCTIILFTITASAFCICAVQFKLTESRINDWEAYKTVVISILAIILITLGILIGIQPHNKDNLYFQVPLVPFSPCVGIVANVYLMCELTVETWIRLGIWCAFGLALYCSYGYFHSKERALQRKS